MNRGLDRPGGIGSGQNQTGDQGSAQQPVESAGGQKGADADILIFDPTKEHVINAGNQHTKTDYTMYENRKVLGAPEMVMQRGEILLKDGELLAKKGRAKFLAANP